MKKILSSLILLSSILFLFSCNKAGTGGDATLVVYLKHHLMTIPNHIGYPDTVFVKFNAKELPGTTAADFDTYFIGEVGEDHVHCENLKPGTYYLFGVGMDTTISSRVAGGFSVKIKNSDSKKETDINLQITE